MVLRLDSRLCAGRRGDAGSGKRYPGLWVLFGARDGNREHTEVVGEFLAVPVIGPQLVTTVKRMLA